MLAGIFKLFLRAMALLPLPITHRVGTALGWLLYLIPNSAKKVASINIGLCFPEYSKSEQKQLLKQSLIESGKTTAEIGLIWMANTEYVLNQVKTVHGQEHLEQALNKNRGVMLAVPHLGSWELLNLYMARHYPLTALYKPPHMQALDNIIRSARQRTGARLVPTDTGGVRSVSKALKNGEIIFILPDQQPYLHMKNGIFANFFGVPANTMTLLPKLVSKTGCEVVYAYARRLENGQGFDIVFMPASERTENVELQQDVERMNHDIETLVRDCPPQYQWTYKRFKARPNNQPRRY